MIFHKFKIGDVVTNSSAGFANEWCSGPDPANPAHIKHLIVHSTDILTVTELWTMPMGADLIWLGYIVSDRYGNRGSFEESQLQPVDNILNKLNKLKILYLEHNTEDSADYMIIESYIESCKNKQPIPKADLQWCNELYRELKTIVA